MSVSYDALLQIISFVFGTLISFAMSWYFYKKADFPSRVTTAMAEEVLLFLVQSKIGVDFNHSLSIPKRELPKDLRVPHILRYWLSKYRVKPGEDIHLLFRVEDTDFDFPGAENIEIVESESNVGFKATRQAHGYYSAKLVCPVHATPGVHFLRLRLWDSKGNEHEHQIKFEVIS